MQKLVCLRILARKREETQKFRKKVSFLFEQRPCRSLQHLQDLKVVTLEAEKSKDNATKMNESKKTIPPFYQLELQNLIFTQI